jgi:hypothetical protein
MHIYFFTLTALFALALAVRAKMQRKEVLWDRGILLGAAQKCLDRWKLNPLKKKSS